MFYWKLYVHVSLLCDASNFPHANLVITLFTSDQSWNDKIIIQTRHQFLEQEKSEPLASGLHDALMCVSLDVPNVHFSCCTLHILLFLMKTFYCSWHEWDKMHSYENNIHTYCRTSRCRCDIHDNTQGLLIPFWP